MNASISSSMKVPPEKAIVLIPGYIMNGFIIYYNPNTNILKVTKKN